MVSLIVAMSSNGVIGRDGDLPWHLPAELARVKQLTTGHCLLMGRKTFESIGRALPGRTTIVVSRGRPELPEGVSRIVADPFSLEQLEAALELDLVFDAETSQ